MGERNFEVFMRPSPPGRPRKTPDEDAERLRVHAAYCRRIGRHSLADALDRGADAIDREEQAANGRRDGA